MLVMLGVWANAAFAGGLPGQTRSGERYWLEVGGMHFELTDDFADTNAAYVRAHIDRGYANTWNLELVHMDRFDDSGTLGVVTNTHDFNPDLFSRVTLSSSTEGFFFPEFRAQGSMNVRLLPRRNLIATAGVSYFDARDIHTDVAVFLESTWYVNDRWVAQGGVRMNRSSPGAVDSYSGYAALTWGRDRDRYVGVRIGGGNQAWQAFADDDFQVDFPFAQVTLTWREWIGKRWGVNVSADGYSSDPYDQYGLEIGVFREF